MYGTAEFQPGMEEVQEPVKPTAPAAPTSPESPVSPVTTVPATDSSTDNGNTPVDANGTSENEGLSLTQKALFLAVIGAIVAVYIRMNTRTPSKGPAYSRV